MKIKISTETKRVITLDKMNAVKALQEDMKQQENLNLEAHSAVRLATGHTGLSVLKIEAEIALNNRVWNYFTDASEDVDVWMTVYAFDPCYGFYSIGAYLSDVWQIGPEERNDEIKAHMYIRHYKEVK